MKVITALSVAGVAAAALVLVLTRGVEQPAGSVSWRVEASKSVQWRLACDFAWVKVRDAYNPNNWVNQLEMQGKGGKTGELLGGDGRCTLSKLAGPGPIRLVLVKGGAEKSQLTDTGQDPAYVVVY